jgi:hypothetical protein
MKKQFSVKVIDYLQKLLLQLIDLQFDAFLLGSSIVESIIILRASLPISIMSELCKLALSRMKQNKSNFHLRITDVHLYEMTRIDISKIEPNINSFRKQRQTQLNIMNVSSGHVIVVFSFVLFTVE